MLQSKHWMLQSIHWMLQSKHRMLESKHWMLQSILYWMLQNMYSLDAAKHPSIGCYKASTHRMLQSIHWMLQSMPHAPKPGSTFCHNSCRQPMSALKLCVFCNALHRWIDCYEGSSIQTCEVCTVACWQTVIGVKCIMLGTRPWKVMLKEDHWIPILYTHFDSFHQAWHWHCHLRNVGCGATLTQFFTHDDRTTAGFTLSAPWTWVQGLRCDTKRSCSVSMDPCCIYSWCDHPQILVCCLCNLFATFRWCSCWAQIIEHWLACDAAAFWGYCWLRTQRPGGSDNHFAISSRSHCYLSMKTIIVCMAHCSMGYNKDATVVRDSL